jgi:hypothetical protein
MLGKRADILEPPATGAAVWRSGTVPAGAKETKKRMGCEEAFEQPAQCHCADGSSALNRCSGLRMDDVCQP